MSYEEALEVLTKGFPETKVKEANEKSLEALRFAIEREKQASGDKVR